TIMPVIFIRKMLIMWNTRQYENIVNFLSSDWYVACAVKSADHLKCCTALYTGDCLSWAG
ncbi:hypothetical protein, partial [Klebsiella pneumoniae]|uniref:hypothetical protein n=1 Tax=Klebsiella pneumoniae TaxID=573 RepID=UPI001D0D020F